MMNLFKGKNRCGKTLPLICALILVMTQIVFVVPSIQGSFASSGGSLEVRVKYFGDQEDKIRTKHTFTAAELRSLHVEEWCYSNVTRVGTVMVMKARGPQILEVIAAAGIDPNSVQRVNFRAGDNYGYTRDFTVQHHLSGGRWYYPELNSNYTTGDDQALIPNKGALANASEVPAILALEFGATKAMGKRAEDLSMGTEDVYRFCLGQTSLSELTPANGSADITSAESIRMIHGIDVTLYGSPVNSIMMDISDGKMKVGSRKRVSAVFSGDELFAEDLAAFAGKLRWSSSDPSVVEVDQSGNIKVLKKGTATVTVTAENGMSASVTIEGVGEEPEKSSAAKTKSKAKSSTGKKSKTKQAAAGAGSTKATTVKSSSSRASSQSTEQAKEEIKSTIVVREINVGDLVAAEQPVHDQMRESMANDAQALGKLRDYGRGAAAGTAGAAVLVGGAGAFLRVRRFWRDTL